MATNTRTITTDDLTGEEGAQRHTFSLDNNHYEIDLTDNTWANMLNDRTAFSGILLNARRITRNGKPNDWTKRAVAANGKRDNAAIRAWAQQNGHPLGDRGRIPAVIIDAYNAAHPTHNN